MSFSVRRILRVGRKSSAIVIPSTWMKQLGLKPGDQVKLFFNGNRVSMAPVKEDDLMRGQVAIEGADRVTFAKLKAAFMEGVSNVKLKADYESAVKLVSDLRREVSPSCLLVSLVVSTTHWYFQRFT